MRFEPKWLLTSIKHRYPPSRLPSNYTMEEKGTFWVFVLGTSYYRQITGTFGVTIAGGFFANVFSWYLNVKRKDANQNSTCPKNLTLPKHQKSKTWLFIFDIFKGNGLRRLKMLLKNLMVKWFTFLTIKQTPFNHLIWLLIRAVKFVFVKKPKADTHKK